MTEFNNDKSEIQGQLTSQTRHHNPSLWEPDNDSVPLLFNLERGLVRIFHAVLAIYLERCLLRRHALVTDTDRLVC